MSEAVECFWADLIEQGQADNTVIWMFSEFGRRIEDNGAGTDHGSGGAAFMIGNPVKGGLYGEYPSLNPQDQLEGDVHYNTDYRTAYASILDDVLHVDSEWVMNRKFDPITELVNA
jgi:uncharacterized protein (DUF1501 family)